MTEPLRVVIAEDAAIMLDGLTHILTHRGHHVAAAVADAPALLAAVDAHRPDIAVIDVRMPPTHTDEGLRAALAIHRRHPQTGVLVFSQYIETRYAAELLAGNPEGVGYLLKDRVANVSEFLAAMHRIAFGGTALDPEVVRQLIGASRRADELATLTPRERQVLALIAEGRLQVLDDPATLELVKRTTPVGVLHPRDPALLVEAALGAIPSPAEPGRGPASGLSR